MKTYMLTRATGVNNMENVQWLVKRYDMVYACQNDIFHNGHCQTNNRVIGEIIKQKFVDAKQIYTPKDIISYMKNDYGITLSYQQTYRSKEKALKLIRGDPRESYNLLPKYSHVLQELNGGTIINLQWMMIITFCIIFFLLDLA